MLHAYEAIYFDKTGEVFTKEDFSGLTLTSLMAALMEKLLEEDRMDDLKQTAKDKEYREKLLKELKIIENLFEKL